MIKKTETRLGFFILYLIYFKKSDSLDNGLYSVAG